MDWSADDFKSLDNHVFIDLYLLKNDFDPLPSIVVFVSCTTKDPYHIDSIGPTATQELSTSSYECQLP